MNGNKPNLTLSMDDKIYLAVSKNDSGKLAFVYTLACHRTARGTNTYDMTAKREIHTFKNRESAQLYHDTIEQIIEVNANNKMFEPFFSFNDKLIEQFLEYTK